MRLEYADGFAGLDQQGLVVVELFQRCDDGVVGLPAARGAAGSAVDDQILGALGDFFVEVVHQHAHGGFLLPAFAGDLIAARGADGGGGLDFCFDGHRVMLLALLGAVQISWPLTRSCLCVCGNLSKINSGSKIVFEIEWATMRSNFAFLRVPPPPIPSNALTGAGSAKSVCKVLSAKGLEVIIFITKHLRPRAGAVAAPSGGPVFCFLVARGKVGCDKAGLWISVSQVENSLSSSEILGHNAGFTEGGHLGCQFDKEEITRCPAHTAGSRRHRWRVENLWAESIPGGLLSAAGAVVLFVLEIRGHGLRSWIDEEVKPRKDEGKGGLL
jgi:hypothetical protein